MHLLPYVSILLTASALNLPLQRRNPCEDVQDYESVYDDGPTADGTAGIGAEFETPLFKFEYKGCSLDDTNAAKKAVVDGRKGTNWFLSADTGFGAGELVAEYILDGVNIKVGSGDGAKAAKAFADDLIDWKPWAGDGPNTVTIENNKCNPWKITAPGKRSDPKTLPFFPQITAPMPLEALYNLMKENKANPINKNVLDGTVIRFDELQLVKQEYFRSNTNGIDRSKVSDDVLAFCTLILSYAKAATNTLKPDQSPKLFIAFMPRTDFNTLYQQVKSKLPGDLFTLFDSLACYKTADNEAGTVVVDTTFCTGELSNPVSNGHFGELSYSNTGPDPHVTVNIRDWIEGIGKQSPSPDLLTKFDESIDSSNGGLGTKMEKMYQSQRSVPLIEFRDLDAIKLSETEDFMNRVDASIQKLHKDFADAPKRKRDLPSECTMAIEPAGTSTPIPDPIVIAPVDPPSQPSCVPSPTDSVKDAHEDELKKAAKYFCDQHATDTNAKAPIDIADTIIAGTRIIGKVAIDMAYPYPSNIGSQDDVYDFSLKSVPNCTPKEGFNLASPVADNQCADILHNAWKNCNNAGRGGEITAGCLVYSVKTKY